MHIEPQTLVTTIVFVSALLGGLQIFSWAQNRSAKDLLIWGLIFLLIALAVGLLTLEGNAPDFVSVTIGEGLLVLGHGLLYSSTRAFNGKPPVFLAGAVGMFAWLIASASDLFITSAEARGVFVSVLIGCYSFLLASEFQQMSREKLPSWKAAVALAITHGLFFFGRAVMLLLQAVVGQSVAFAGSWSTVLALEALTAAVSLAFVFMSLSKERVALQFRNAALTDQLTGAGNRRALFELGEAMLLVAREKLETVSLMLLDIDWFKQINDRLGHPTGDKVLHAVATCISRSIPPSALLARLGGDEFAILLPNTDQATAGMLAERIRERIGSLGFAADGRSVDVMVSLGVAESPQGLNNLLELISAADAALYIAKSNGRNRVQVHGLSDWLETEAESVGRVGLRKRSRSPQAVPLDRLA
jgi:diguanylate cyclase (GGDEF)-like protein